MTQQRTQGPVTLSIVVVNFETPDYTLQCIRSVYLNPPACGFEIILIDTGITEGIVLQGRMSN